MVWVAWGKKKGWQMPMHVDTHTQVIWQWGLWQTSGTGCESRCRIEKNLECWLGRISIILTLPKWNGMISEMLFVPGKSQELSQYSECQTSTRNRAFFNAERNQNSVSRPSEWRSGLLLYQTWSFGVRWTKKPQVNGAISMIRNGVSLKAPFLPTHGRYTLLLLIGQSCN